MLSSALPTSATRRSSGRKRFGGKKVRRRFARKRQRVSVKIVILEEMPADLLRACLEFLSIRDICHLHTTARTIRLHLTMAVVETGALSGIFRAWDRSFHTKGRKKNLVDYRKTPIECAFYSMTITASDERQVQQWINHHETLWGLDFLRPRFLPLEGAQPSCLEGCIGNGYLGVARRVKMRWQTAFDGLSTGEAAVLYRSLEKVAIAAASTAIDFGNVDMMALFSTVCPGSHARVSPAIAPGTLYGWIREGKDELLSALYPCFGVSASNFMTDHPLWEALGQAVAANHISTLRLFDYSTFPRPQTLYASTLLGETLNHTEPISQELLSVLSDISVLVSKSTVLEVMLQLTQRGKVDMLRRLGKDPAWLERLRSVSAESHSNTNVRLLGTAIANGRLEVVRLFAQAPWSMTTRDLVATKPYKWFFGDRELLEELLGPAWGLERKHLPQIDIVKMITVFMDTAVDGSNEILDILRHSNLRVVASDFTQDDIRTILAKEHASGHQQNLAVLSAAPWNFTFFAAA